MIFAKRAKISPKLVIVFSFTRLESRVYQYYAQPGPIIIPFPPEAGQVVCLKPIMDVSCYFSCSQIQSSMKIYNRTRNFHGKRLFLRYD